MKLRFGKLLIVPVAAMALAGGSYALTNHTLSAGPDDVSTVTSPSASPSPDDNVARVHGDATSCPLPEGVTLSGNWTHGDYVSAWAKTGDHDKTLAAAKSDCGKPESSVKPEPSASESAKDNHGADVSAEHRNDHADDADENGEDNGKDDEARGDHAGSDHTDGQGEVHHDNGLHDAGDDHGGNND